MMKMKILNNIYRKVLVVLLAVAMVACDPSDFGDINDDPNNTTNPETALLLTASLRNLRATANPSSNFRNSRAGTHYVQYVGNTQYTGDDNYEQIKFGDFNFWYDGPLADLQFIQDFNMDDATKDLAAKSGSNDNQIGVAKILTQWYYLYMTSRFGDLPYSQALQAAADPQILDPVYDTQQDIFNGIFAELKAARNLILADPNDAPVSGDIFFDGDMDRWVQWSNTIRLIAALRLSDANPTQGQTEFNAAMGDGLITWDVNYPFLPEAANENAWFSSFRTRDDWSLSHPIVDYMNINTESNPWSGVAGMMDVVRDPRLYQYGNPTDNSITDPLWPEYAGQPYGLLEAIAGSLAIQDVSMLSFYMRTQDLAYPMTTMAQVLFSRAEAAMMGWTGENAQQMYYDAIAASIDSYGMTDGPAGDGVGGYADYITNAEVVWTTGREMEQIATQKWVALYLVGYEGWNNWRRTGWPVLQPSANGIQSDVIPIRQAYPDTERDLNSVNWQAALDRQFGGTDDLNGELWLFPRSSMWEDGDRN